MARRDAGSATKEAFPRELTVWYNAGGGSVAGVKMDGDDAVDEMDVEWVWCLSVDVDVDVEVEVTSYGKVVEVCGLSAMSVGFAI